jgi:anti-sigma factor RsiW
MNCADCEILLHALLDGELDAGHARDVESHLAGCKACAEQLKAFGAMRTAMTAANLKEAAPERLRSRIEAALPAAGTLAAAPRQSQPAPSGTSWLRSRLASWVAAWRTFLGGFAIGTAVSAALAASLVIAIVRDGQNRQITDEVVSAHLRSLQAGHLMDVETSDQHTVKPWFNGKVDVAPPVIDLTAEGFTLIGGRLDYIDGEPVASVVYQRRKHIINLFVAQQLADAARAQNSAVVQGYNARHWRDRGLDYWAVSDIAPEELDEFVAMITAALNHPA